MPRVRIFLSYAREDKAKVEEVYRRLSAAGFSPWMDTRDILPGQKWEDRIRRAIRSADIFLACLSRHSRDKRGWVQRELKIALDAWTGMLPDDLYLIPARLETCDLPDSLSEFEATDLFEDEGWTRLLMAIEEVAKRLGGDGRVGGEPRQGLVPEASPREVMAPQVADLSMRAIDLAFLEERSLECVLYWRNGAAYDFQANAWKPMSPNLVPKCLSGYLFRKEVFVCLRGDHLLEGYDHTYIRNLLGVVRVLTGGASSYLVKDRAINVSALEHSPISSWMDGVFEGGATDIVEIEMANRYDLQPLEIRRLRAASDASRQRLRTVSPVDRAEMWGCHVPRAEYFLLWFLQPFVIHPQQNGYDGNSVIILKNFQEPQQQFLANALKSFTRKRLIVWLSSLPPVIALQSLCSEQNLKLIHCHGSFELRYLLLQLNKLNLSFS